MYGFVLQKSSTLNAIYRSIRHFTRRTHGLLCEVRKQTSKSRFWFITEHKNPLLVLLICSVYVYAWHICNTFDVFFLRIIIDGFYSFDGGIGWELEEDRNTMHKDERHEHYIIQTIHRPIHSMRWCNISKEHHNITTLRLLKLIYYTQNNCTRA